ncbi:MAG: hypothetical protein K2X45_04895 [Phreatobacter sp.]|nr:hypothetical protein [Phreatobacter sp.]
MAKRDDSSAIDYTSFLMDVEEDVHRVRALEEALWCAIDSVVPEGIEKNALLTLSSTVTAGLTRVGLHLSCLRHRKLAADGKPVSAEELGRCEAMEAALAAQERLFNFTRPHAAY